MSDDDHQRQTSAALAGQLQDGSNDAARLLFDRFGPWLKNAVDHKIGGRLRRRVDADDILQSAFWSFFRRTADGQYSFEHSGALCRMLLTIAENKIRKAADYHHRQRRDVDLEQSMDACVCPSLADDRQWQQTAFELAETIDDIAQIVDSLEPRDAEFFRRRFFLGHASGKIAAETGWSLATVKRVLHRVTERVRTQVKSRLDA